jgi:hypothetical protein
LVVSGTPSLTVWGTTITSGAGVDTLGVYSGGEILSATAFPYDIHLLELWLAGSSSSAADSSTLLSIGTGSSGAEVVLIPNIPVGHIAAATVSPRPYIFPCFIPSGTRIAMKTQSITSSRALQVSLFVSGYFGRSGSRLGVPKKFQSIGFNTTGSRGTSHTPGSTGTYSTLANIGSVAEFEGHFMHLIPSGQGTKSDVTMTNISYIVEVSSNSGAVVYGRWYVGNSTNETQISIPAGPVPVGVPKGTQLQIRAKASGTAEAQDYVIILSGN